MKNWMIGTVAAVALLAACGGQDAATGKSPATAELTIGEITIPALSLRDGDAGKASEALAALSLDSSGAGRVKFSESSVDGADAIFNDVFISIDGDEGISAGSLTLTGLDMTDSGASFSQMRFNDITASPPDDEVGPISIASLQLTNPSAELASWVASLMGEGAPAEFPGISALSFDGLAMTNLVVDAQGNDELEAFNVGNIDLRKLSDEGIGSMVLEGVKIAGKTDGETIDVSLGSAQIAGVGATMFKALQLAAGGAPEAVVSELASLMQANPGDPGYDAFLLDAFNVDAMGVGFNLPSVEAAVTRDTQGRATRSVTKPYSMSVTADPEGQLGGQLAGVLGMMGYETLNFRAANDIKMDPDADTISFNAADNFLSLEDGFTFSLGGDLGGLSAYYAAIADAVQNGLDDEEAGLAALAALSLNGLEIELTDNSIVERGFATAGAMTQQDPAALQAQATAGVAALPFLASQAGVDAAIANDLAGAIASFLADSGTLQIKLDPSEPLSAANIQDPSELTKDRLGFSAKTK